MIGGGRSIELYDRRWHANRILFQFIVASYKILGKKWQIRMDSLVLAWELKKASSNLKGQLIIFYQLPDCVLTMAYPAIPCLANSELVTQSL
jgi:hypothetical protein